MSNLNDLQCWAATDDDVAPLVAHARALWAKDERDRALRLIRTVVFVAPAAQSAWATLAEIHASRGESETAGTLIALGRLLSRIHEPEEAS